MHRKAVFALGVLSLSMSMAAAERCTLRGEIASDTPVRLQDLAVELQGSNSVPERAYVSNDGRFEFREVEAGHYRVRVTTLHGDVIREEFAHVASNLETMTIRLRGSESARPGNGGISARRLSHRPPKDAVKAWREAAKASGKGDHAAARNYLERSVAMDPEYFEAQLSLGGELIFTGDLDGALTAFDRALEIDPSSSPALVNRGLVLLHFRKMDEAVVAGRKALTLGGDPVPAHYLLGIGLAARGRDLEEALEHLKISAPRFEHARKALEMLQTQLSHRH